MLQQGELVEGSWRVGRLLLDDGLAEYFTVEPVGEAVSGPPPMLLLRAVAASDIGSIFPSWPLRVAGVEAEGLAERIWIGPEERKVLTDVFDVTPTDPVYREGHRLDAGKALEYFLEACRLVAAHHAGHWVCRTLNPRSFFQPAPSDKLALYPLTSAEREGQVLKSIAGTPGYIAPEAWEPAKADPSHDIYALGAILYAWLSGRHPFEEAETVQEIRDAAKAGSLPDLSREFPEVPPGAGGLIAKATAPHPLDRPRKVTDLARMAREALAASAREKASARPERKAQEDRPAASRERSKPRRETRILPFSLEDIIDETNHQG